MDFSDEMIKKSNVLVKTLEKYISILEEQKETLDEIYKNIENAKAIHTWGKGRSGTAAVALALRLKQFGYNVWFIGDTIKEPIRRGDVVILFSGSGETAEIVDVAKKARRDEATVISITSYKESELAKFSDLIFWLPGGMEKKKGWDYLEAQLTNKKQPFYGGGEFELLAYLFQESFVNSIGSYKGISQGKIAKEHERDETIS
ncbi:MAG: SIS domain-containing protein [Candidatus Aenigmatarchaeota archaeon]